MKNNDQQIMTKNKKLKIEYAIVLAGLMGLWGCGNMSHSNSTDTTVRTDSVSVAVTQDDKKFMVSAAQINLLEIQVGKLAEQNSVSSDVKEMGRMLVDDHTKLWNELTKLAGAKSVTLPNALVSDGQKDYDKLAAKTGSDFDKAFADAMVDGHKDAISLFQNESKETKDNDIAKWATESVPTLQKHLDQAVSIKDRLK